MREFVKGDGLLPAPGMLGKLDESWTGPWEVESKCGPVTYKIKDGERKKEM